MFPYFSIAGRTISSYSLFSLAGVLLALLYYLRVRRRSGFPEADGELAIISGITGAFSGAKILFLITVLPEFCAEFRFLFSDTELFLEKYLYSGFVFYGGFFGMLFAAFFYCRHARLDFSECLRLLFPMIPLAHAFGRVGCFCMGCCYGRKSALFGIAFDNSPVAPNHIPLIPVQLFEAAGELLLFFVTAHMAAEKKNGFLILAFWLVSYGLIRFFTEFLRGDAYRGFLGPLSLSQIISAAAAIFGIVLLIRYRKK